MGEANTMANGQHFAFVLNALSLDGNESYEIAPQHVLRRASAHEIAHIKGFLQRTQGFVLQSYPAVWESEWPHPGGVIKLLPENEWRYFVIAFNGFNDTLMSIQEAFDISMTELEIGLSSWIILCNFTLRAYSVSCTKQL